MGRVLPGAFLMAGIQSNESGVRLKDAWYCTDHLTIHLGCFGMQHRVHLHPIYVQPGPAEALPAGSLRVSSLG